MGTHGSLGIFIIFIYLLILTIFIGVELLYTVVLVSDAQQYESVTRVCVYICIYTHTLFFGFLSHLGHPRALSSLCYIVGFHEHLFYT